MATTNLASLAATAVSIDSAIDSAIDTAALARAAVDSRNVGTESVFARCPAAIARLMHGTNDTTHDITESQIMRAPETAHKTLQSIRALGVRIAIDDFGTGYSSLSQLQFFPVDELKIDRTFVARLEDGERAASFVKTMITLAHSLGVDVVAEGIERESQRAILAALGCSAGQGYLFSRPLTIDDTIMFVATHEQTPLPAAHDG